MSLSLLCRAERLPEPVMEFQFHPSRKWRFDWAWVDQKVALEIEGGAFVGGRHTRGAGYTRDMAKYNAAQLLGWKVFRCVPNELLTVGFDTVKEALWQR